MRSALNWEGCRNLEEGLEFIESGKSNAITFYQHILGDEGIALVVEALRGNKTCWGLSLQGTGMGDKGLAELAKVINSTSLKWLSVSDNDISVEGIRQFASILESNDTLLELYLHDNHFGDEGAWLLLDALKTNFYLQVVDIKRCRVNAAAPKVEILRLVQRNRRSQRTLWQKSCDGETERPWRRAKLMVVGQGRAGKTSTVRSLLGLGFDENLESTIGASLSKTEIQDNNTKTGEVTWRQSDDTSFAARHIAGIYVDGMKKRKDAERLSKLPSEETASTKQMQPILKQSNIIAKHDQVKAKEMDPEVAKKVERNMILQTEKEGDSIRYAIWDYGGQEVFYTLHHLLLTRYGMYMVVFNINELLYNTATAEEYLRFWINSISLHAREAPILLVATFVDELDDSVSQLNEANQYIQQILGNDFSQLVPHDQYLFFPVSNKNQSEIKRLRQKVDKVTRCQAYVNTPIKVKWTSFLDRIMTIPNAERFDHNGTIADEKYKPWLSLNEVRKIATELSISNKECDDLLKLFHEMGIILHFTGTDNLRNIVTTNPQWLIDSLSLVIRDSVVHAHDMEAFAKAGLADDLQRLTNDSLLTEDLMSFLWQGQEGFMLDLMQRTLLLSDWSFGSSNSRMYLVPSLLKDSNSKFFEESNVEETSESSDLVCKFDFSEGFLPNGVFQRLVCLCVSHASRIPKSAEPILSKTGAKLFFGDDVVFLHKKTSSINMTVPSSHFAAEALAVIKSMMRKIKADVMEEMRWNIFVEKIVPGKQRVTTDSLNIERSFIRYEKAQKKKLQPWFVHNCTEAQKADTINLELGSFLDSL